VSPDVHFVLGFNKFVMENIGTREYTVLPKGSGFVYAYANWLYRRVKTQGSTKYLKCTTVGCDGSAKLVDGLLFIVCHCSIKRLLNVSASTAYTDSCDCFANYITNMNYNIRLTVISINCKNCPIGCPYNLFLRFPPLRVGAEFSSLAFSVAPTLTTVLR